MKSTENIRIIRGFLDGPSYICIYIYYHLTNYLLSIGYLIFFLLRNVGQQIPYFGYLQLVLINFVSATAQSQCGGRTPTGRHLTTSKATERILDSCRAVPTMIKPGCDRTPPAQWPDRNLAVSGEYLISHLTHRSPSKKLPDAAEKEQTQSNRRAKCCHRAGIDGCLCAIRSVLGQQLLKVGRPSDDFIPLKNAQFFGFF